MAQTPAAETTAGRKSAYKRGLALPPPSPGAAPGFPVTSGDQWDKARQAVGRVGSPARRAALGRLLKKTAGRFGKSTKGTWMDNSGDTEAIELAQMQCPRCGYQSDDADFTASPGSQGASLQKQPGELRTPANAGLQSSAGYSPGSAGVSVRSGAGGAGLSNGRGREIALSRRLPVRSASDVVISRQGDGTAVLRHRAGGATIGTIRRDGRGYRASLEGRGDLDPRTHERTAVQDLIGGWNSTAASPFRAAPPLQAPPRQTPLMQRFGVPAIRALAADPDNDGDDDSSPSGDTDNDGGLNPKGQAVYRKLKAKGWPDDRAMAFARRAQNMTAGSFKKAS